MATVIQIPIEFLNNYNLGGSEMDKTIDQYELRKYIIENYNLAKWYSFWGWFQDKLYFGESLVNEVRFITDGVIADKITVVYDEGFKFDVSHMNL